MVFNVGRGVQMRMGLGSEFHRERAAMEKALSPRFGAWSVQAVRGCFLWMSGGPGRGCGGGGGLKNLFLIPPFNKMTLLLE